MSRKTLLLAGLGLFAALSLTDFVQTYALLTDPDRRVTEANPVAARWLDESGWGGLAAFKAGTVAVVAAAAWGLVARRRPGTAAGVVALGCAAVLAVTVRSGRLLAEPGGPEAVAVKCEYDPPPAELLRPGSDQLRYRYPTAPDGPAAAL